MRWGIASLEGCREESSAPERGGLIYSTRHKSTSRRGAMKGNTVEGITYLPLASLVLTVSYTGRENTVIIDGSGGKACVSPRNTSA